MIFIKTYYIFKIHDHLALLYKNTPQVLFDMLKQISRVNKKDLNFAYNLLKELIVKIEKDNLITHFRQNKNLLTTIIDPKTTKITVLSNNTKMKVISNFLYLKIETEENDISALNLNDKNLFLCDFKNDKYFWLNK